MGEWEHGKYGPLTFEGMRRKYAQTLKATLDHFGGDVLNEVHGVYLTGTEICVCLTGNSPNSPAHARLIAQSPTLAALCQRALDLIGDEPGEPEEAELRADIKAALRAVEGQ